MSDDPRVSEIMERDVVTVRPDVTVKELADLFREHDIGAAPVVDAGGRLVGVVTEGDLVAEDADLHFPHYIQFLDSIIYLESVHKFEQRLKKAVGASVADVMTREVLTVSPEESVRAAATIMADHRVGQVPVVDGGRLVGLVTRHDVLRSLGL